MATTTIAHPLAGRLLTPGRQLVRRSAAGGLAAVALSMATPAFSDELPPLPGGDSTRVEAQAQIDELNRALLASPSATQTLEAWCASHRIASPARITAERVRGADKPISADQRARLQIGADEPVRYRRVRLACGAHVLSEADNWYVPSRLTPEMNRLLDTTDIPFGRVILPLGPHRTTLAAEPLWSAANAPKAKNSAGGSQLTIPEFILRHRALVLDGGGRPIAEVVESYRGEALRPGGGQMMQPR